MAVEWCLVMCLQYNFKGDGSEYLLFYFDPYVTKLDPQSLDTRTTSADIGMEMFCDFCTLYHFNSGKHSLNMLAQ